MFFWEHGLPEPIADADYDTAAVWKLRRRGVDLAPLVVFKEGCAVDKDMGFIVPARVRDYAKIVELVRKQADAERLRAALVKLATRLKDNRDGVFTRAVDATVDELVVEFEARLQRFSGTQAAAP